MLVLSRRRGESIIVGDDIEIRILEVHGNQVKIGIQAPTHHTVHRKEVYLAIHGKAAGRFGSRDNSLRTRHHQEPGEHPASPAI